MATFEEMNPGSVKTDGHAERKCLGLPDTEATPDHLRGAPQHCDGGSSYNEFWDTGFAGEGDPYGIGAEYVSQSANPDAAKFAMGIGTHDGTPISGGLPIPAIIPPQDASVPDSAPITSEYAIVEVADGFELRKGDIELGTYRTREDADAALKIAEAH